MRTTDHDYEPDVEIVEDAHPPLSQWNKSFLCDFGEDARRQGQPEGQDLVLIMPDHRIAGMACVAGESKHESMHPSGRSLQTSLGDGCI